MTSVARALDIQTRQKKGTILIVQTFKRLLVIVDPDNEADYSVERAILLAFYYKASVRLIMHKPNAQTQQDMLVRERTRQLLAEQHQRVDEYYQSQLDKCLNRFSTQGIEAQARLGHDKNGDAWMQAQIQDYQPDLVIKSIQDQSRLSRILITSTDWKLVTSCPCPLLLVKAQPWHDSGCIMAAVDPMHSKAQQSQLDHLLLNTTVNLANRVQLNAKVFHSYLPDISNMFPKVINADEYIQEIRQQHLQSLRPLLAEHGLQEDALCLKRGNLIRTLSQVIRQEKVNILVLGALSRNFVEKAIIGSTAEKILHDTSCDVLVMKHITGSKA
ncbi:hypothetical protein GCM10011403_06300 [Pseudohongiella nitratireducens]|uniref:UspA domain-containing protein n=1 Tax=Pseudohongiella nitratireducens TaxID=1768907 RepID=A0A917LQN8_9GAMM|nr:hypothetical protein GCM10011403_06300 [Pseudohongiella nitratireducens]